MVKKGKFKTDKEPCDICVEAKKQWEINGAFSNVFGTYYSRDIFGDNASIGFAKVSFDFDGTLSQDKIQKIAESKIENGDDVYIITKREKSDNVLEIANKLGIPEKNVVFTNHKPKWSFIKELGIDVHYDNVGDEVKEIEDKTEAKVIKVDSNVNYAAESYDDYPKGASDAAQRALDWVEKHGWGDCLTPVGKKRAHQLANREPISRETISRMAAFARHLQYEDKELGDGCAKLAILAWGSRVGIEWAQRKLEQIDKEKFVVEPGEKETKDEFIQRCMSVEVGDGFETSQAYAICISKWEKK